MADSENPAPAGERAAEGGSADPTAGSAAPQALKPGTASYARETQEKDDCLVKNPQVMEDYKKAVDKKNREKAAAEGGQQK